MRVAQVCSCNGDIWCFAISEQDMGFHPSYFFTVSWLCLLLVSEEGPSVVTKSIRVSRRCRVPPPSRGTSQGGAEPAPLGRREG